MRTGMFCAGKGMSWLLLLGHLLISGCCHRASQCQPGGCSDSGAACATSYGGMPAASSAGPATAPAASGYGGQTTCPVSGAVLGRSGPAVAVNVKGRTIYVCCQACAAKVQAAPDLYLARVAAELAGRAAQATPLARLPYGGQKTCPVTGEELAADGSAVPVTVNGQTLYVCCDGCAAKVKRNPDAYLARVAAERNAQVGKLP